MTTVQNISEFLCTVDCEYNDDEIRDFSTSIGVCETEDEKKVLEGFLSFRKAFEEPLPLHTVSAKAAVKEVVNAAFAEDAEAKQESITTCWKWLLDTKQVEQRTPEWYAETREVLTASEVSKIYKKGRTRDLVVAAKAKDKTIVDPPAFVPRLAVQRSESGPMDWGVRYEPLVKAYLEKSLDCKIHELGRIRHQSQAGLAASPDGLFISCEKEPDLVGHLVEIKCPTTRIIKENTISLEYMCQMQLQLEVCGRPVCEFVEAKFREPKDEADRTLSALDRGFITLQSNIQTDTNRYLYHYTNSAPLDDLWATVETYEWELVFIQRVSVPRDIKWFEGLQSHLVEFWKDVDSARNGTWQITPAREKKVKESAETLPTKCEILIDE